MKLPKIGLTFKNTFKEWTNDSTFTQSAAVGYYAIFAFPALLVIIVSIAGFVTHNSKVSDVLFSDIASTMGKGTATQVSQIIEKAGNTGHTILASVISIVALLVGATGVFTELQKSLNYIFEVKPKPNAGFMKLVIDRLFSFGLIVSIAFLLLVSLVLTSLLAGLEGWLKSYFSEVAVYFAFVVNELLSFGIITFLFALMFKILPDVKLPWKPVWKGALLTGILFILGKYGLALYFGKAKPESAYGAAGSIVLIMLWVYYSSMILFFGANFIKQYLASANQKIEPEAHAEKTDQSDAGDKKKP
jgi:membrane protein